MHRHGDEAIRFPAGCRRASFVHRRTGNEGRWRGDEWRRHAARLETGGPSATRCHVDPGTDNETTDLGRTSAAAVSPAPSARAPPDIPMQGVDQPRVGTEVVRIEHAALVVRGRRRRHPVGGTGCRRTTSARGDIAMPESNVRPRTSIRTEIDMQLSKRADQAVYQLPHPRKPEKVGKTPARGTDFRRQAPRRRSRFTCKG